MPLALMISHAVRTGVYGRGIVPSIFLNQVIEFKRKKSRYPISMSELELGFLE
jgi:hypothetical protein